MEPTKLERRRLSTASLVFIIIAASAPLTVLAGGIPTNFAVAGLLERARQDAGIVFPGID